MPLSTSECEGSSSELLPCTAAAPVVPGCRTAVSTKSSPANDCLCYTGLPHSSDPPAPPQQADTEEPPLHYLPPSTNTGYTEEPGLTCEWERHEDGLNSAACLEPKGGSPVVHQVELYRAQRGTGQGNTAEPTSSVEGNPSLTTCFVAASK